MTMTPQRSQQQRLPQRDPTAIQVRRWDPFQQMENMYQTMGALLQDFFGDGGIRGGWSAPADIEETDDAYLIELDLPGVKPEDVNVELRDNLLRVIGEIKERERSGILRRRSRRVGSFEHVVSLPGDVDANRVEAKLVNGVLTVRVAKPATSQPRRIEVKGA
jgi:HSP20 family protein